VFVTDSLSFLSFSTFSFDFFFFVSELSSESLCFVFEFFISESINILLYYQKNMSESSEVLLPLEIISTTNKIVAYRDSFPELQAEKKLIDEIKNKMRNEDYDESENESVSIEVNNEQNKVNDEKNKEFRDIEIQVDEVKQDN